MKKTDTILTSLDIFGRLIEEAEGEISQSTARYLLSLGFSDSDKARMHDLAHRNQQGRLSEAETELLYNYARVGDLLAFLHSRARQALRKKKVS